MSHIIFFSLKLLLLSHQRTIYKIDDGEKTLDWLSSNLSYALLLNNCFFFSKFHLFRWYSFLLNLKRKCYFLTMQNNFCWISLMKSIFSNKRWFSGIFTNVISNKGGFVKVFINPLSNKWRFEKILIFYEIPSPISPTKSRIKRISGIF